jgi:hypothetical protein
VEPVPLRPPRLLLQHRLPQFPRQPRKLQPLREPRLLPLPQTERRQRVRRLALDSLLLKHKQKLIAHWTRLCGSTLVQKSIISAVRATTGTPRAALICAKVERQQLECGRQRTKSIRRQRQAELGGLIEKLPNFASFRNGCKLEGSIPARAAAIAVPMGSIFQSVNLSESLFDRLNAFCPTRLMRPNTSTRKSPPPERNGPVTDPRLETTLRRSYPVVARSPTRLIRRGLDVYLLYLLQS